MLWFSILKIIMNIFNTKFNTIHYLILFAGSIFVIIIISLIIKLTRNIINPNK